MFPPTQVVTACPFSTRVTPGISHHPSRRGTLYYYVPMCFFLHLHAYLRHPWVFLELSAEGHAGGSPLHHGESLDPGRVPWRMFWVSKSRNLARNDGAVFRGATVGQDNGKTTCQLFCSTAVKALYFAAATVQEQSHIILCELLLYVCGICVSILCVLRYVCVRKCVRVCVLVS